ncbi:uncharacterized protein [Dermacentor albipictus]|uniref:uncharacterized protein n=1 Tax=Dermacentor albipictus TaxID=60249 RepID=UPI0038FD3C91
MAGICFACDPPEGENEAGPADIGDPGTSGLVGNEASARNKVRKNLFNSDESSSVASTIAASSDKHVGKKDHQGKGNLLPSRAGGSKPTAKKVLSSRKDSSYVNPRGTNRMAEKRYASEERPATSTGYRSTTRSSSSGREEKRGTQTAHKWSKASGQSGPANARRPRSSSSSGVSRRKRRTSSRISATSWSSSSSSSTIKRGVKRDPWSRSSSTVSGHKGKIKKARRSGTTSIVSTGESAVDAKQQRRLRSMSRHSGGNKHRVKGRSVSESSTLSCLSDSRKTKKNCRAGRCSSSTRSHHESRRPTDAPSSSHSSSTVSTRKSRKAKAAATRKNTRGAVEKATVTAKAPRTPKSKQASAEKKSSCPAVSTVKRPTRKLKTKTSEDEARSQETVAPNPGMNAESTPGTTRKRRATTSKGAVGAQKSDTLPGTATTYTRKARTSVEADSTEKAKPTPGPATTRTRKARTSEDAGSAGKIQPTPGPTTTRSRKANTSEDVGGAHKGEKAAGTSRKRTATPSKDAGVNVESETTVGATTTKRKAKTAEYGESSQKIDSTGKTGMTRERKATMPQDTKSPKKTDIPATARKHGTKSTTLTKTPKSKPSTSKDTNTSKKTHDNTPATIRRRSALRKHLTTRDVKEVSSKRQEPGMLQNATKQLAGVD